MICRKYNLALAITMIFLAAQLTAAQEVGIGVGIVPSKGGGGDREEKIMTEIARDMQGVKTTYAPTDAADMFSHLLNLKESGLRINFLVIAGHGSKENPRIDFSGGELAPEDVDLPKMRKDLDSHEKALQNQGISASAKNQRCQKVKELKERIKYLESISEVMTDNAVVLLINCSTAATAAGETFVSDVEKVLRQPIKAVSAAIFEYALPSGPGQIFIEFRAEGSIVERIERVFPKPVSREGMVRALKLPESPTGKLINKEGRLVEYFGGIKVLALTYASAEPNSGIVSLGYYSLELFESAMDRVRNPRVEYDPNACRDLFTWARSEEDAAKRAKDVMRRQSVMEIMILSQRGDCEKAQNLAAGYKTRYR